MSNARKHAAGTAAVVADANYTGALNITDKVGVYSTEVNSGSAIVNKPSNAGNLAHFVSITDSSPDDVKTQWYYESDGRKLWMRNQWGSGQFKNWVPVFQPGSVLQVMNAEEGATATVTTDSWVKVMDGPVMSRSYPDSKFIVLVNANIGYTLSLSNGDQDNYAVGIGVNGSVMNLTSRTGYLRGGNGASGFTGSDVPAVGGGTYGTTYDSTYKSYTTSSQPSGAVGTNFTFQLYLSNPYSTGTSYFNRCAVTSTSGGLSSITVMEVLP